MARVKKPVVDKAEARRRRRLNKIPRKPRDTGPDPEDRTWAIEAKHRMIAAGIMNNVPCIWWGSIPKKGPNPVSGYLPCCHFEADDRVYYGFGFRHHRDEWVETTEDARKEYRDVVIRKGARAWR